MSRVSKSPPQTHSTAHSAPPNTYVQTYPLTPAEIKKITTLGTHTQGANYILNFPRTKSNYQTLLADDYYPSKYWSTAVHALCEQQAMILAINYLVLYPHAHFKRVFDLYAMREGIECENAQEGGQKADTAPIIYFWYSSTPIFNYTHFNSSSEDILYAALNARHIWYAYDLQRRAHQYMMVMQDQSHVLHTLTDNPRSYVKIKTSLVLELNTKLQSMSPVIDFQEF